MEEEKEEATIEKEPSSFGWKAAVRKAADKVTAPLKEEVGHSLWDDVIKEV